MRVFSVPLSVPFLRTVIAALVDGRLVEGFEARRDPLNLATATLYLPTRRAGRLAREIFLDELKTDAAILPRIVALGDIDEDELAFSEGSEQFSGVAPLDIPPRLGELERRLTLAHLVAAWAKSPVSAPLVVGGPASTLALAGDLARLMDDMVTRGVAWEALDRLVPDQFDKYWQHSLEFLRIARKAWPEHLKEIGRIEPAERRDRLIEAEAARLTAHHEGPVVAAGSTGSMPATAKFLNAVAGLKLGAVVLPGLDTDLDEEAWQTIGGVRDAQGKFTTQPSSNHPQFAMHGLLDRFGIKRSDVEILGTPALQGRDVLVSETMRPSSAMPTATPVMFCSATPTSMKRSGKRSAKKLTIVDSVRSPTSTTMRGSRAPRSTSARPNASIKMPISIAPPPSPPKSSPIGSASQPRPANCFQIAGLKPSGSFAALRRWSAL